MRAIASALTPLEVRDQGLELIILYVCQRETLPSSVVAPLNKGQDVRRGRGPKKGAPNAGRPPDEFKVLLAALASREETEAGCIRIPQVAVRSGPGEYSRS